MIYHVIYHSLMYSQANRRAQSNLAPKCAVGDSTSPIVYIGSKTVSKQAVAHVINTIEKMVWEA